MFAIMQAASCYPCSLSSMWDSYLIDLNVKYGYAKQNVSKYNPKGLPMRIERFTPHYLRHTYATILYLQGVDMVTAKQYLGHSDIRTTINIYTDLENNSKISLSDSYKKKLKRNTKSRPLDALKSKKYAQCISKCISRFSIFPLTVRSASIFTVYSDSKDCRFESCRVDQKPFLFPERL